MAPLNGTEHFMSLNMINSDIEPGLGRTAKQQGGYQIATVAVTLAVAIGGGLVTGNNRPTLFINILDWKNESLTTVK